MRVGRPTSYSADPMLSLRLAVIATTLVFASASAAKTFAGRGQRIRMTNRAPPRQGTASHAPVGVPPGATDLL